MGLKLKQLGLGVAAVLALSLVVTSFASAANFIASSYPANFSGEGVKGTWKFTTEAGSSECRASSSAVLSEASSTLTVTNAAASECTTNSGGNVVASTTNPEGCDSLIHITKGSGDSYTGTADLVCPAGKSVLAYDNEKFCEIRIPPQTATVSLEYTNNTEKGWVEGKVTSSNITYNVIKDSGFFCPYSGTGTKTGATITQTSPSYLKLEGGTVHIG